MKRKLLFAMLCIASALGLKAQQDVSKYIKNATLSSLDGWTSKNFNKPEMGNNTAGYASEAYAGWNGLEITEFSLKQTITLPKGNYTLVNYSFYRQGEGATTNPTKSLGKLKAGDKEVDIKTLGSITAGGYANSQAEGANCFDSKMYRNTVDFTIDADDTTIEIGLEGTFDEMRSWCIAGMFELINNDLPATMDAPFDVTGYITNPGFEYRDLTGWTVNGGIGTQNNGQSFKVGGYYAEKWQASASGALPECSISQTIENLPAGYYKLTANLGGDGTYFSLNGKTVSWTADADYTTGYVLGEGEPLTIIAGKTAEGTANWVHFDNFRLLFCGDVKAALTSLIARLDSYEGIIPTSAYNALQADVEGYDKDYSDVDELLDAIGAVQKLYADADGLKASYAAAISFINDAKTLQAVSHDNAEANAVLKSAIEDAENLLEEATTVTAIEAVTPALKDAMTEYVSVANPANKGDKFDITFLITNPSFETGDMTGWTAVNSSDTGVKEQSNGTYSITSGATTDGKYLFNNWGGTNELYVQQTIKNLPAGAYTLSAILAGFNGEELILAANDNKNSVIVDGDQTTGYIVEVSFTLTETSDVVIKASNTKGVEGSNASFIKADNFNLVKSAPIVEANIKVQANAYATFVAPFDVEIPEGVTASKVTGNNGATLVLENLTGTIIPAHTPVVLFSETAVEETVEGIATEGTPEAGLLTGVYAETTAPEGSYVLQNQDNVVGFYLVDSEIKVPANRAYLTVEGGDVKGFFFGSDAATAVKGIEAAGEEAGAIYNLAGQRVEKAVKGVYIINGKKVLVK